MIQRKIIVPIVEGRSEIEAAPLLLRRLLFEKNPPSSSGLTIGQAKSAKDRGKLVKEFETFLEYAFREAECAAILTLLDADKDCAKDLAISLANRARALKLPVPIALVCAKCEYEAWFLASLESIAGKPIKGRPGLKAGIRYEGEVEERRGAKEWLSDHMVNRTYKEVEDQPAMTQLLDFNLVRPRSRSFRRLEHALDELLDAIDRQKTEAVTPASDD